MTRVWKLRITAVLPSVLLLVVVLVANDRVLRTAVRENAASRVNWIYHSEPTEFDIAILGSSMLKEGIDPSLLAEETDQSVVQLAWGGRGVSEQALYWELFLKRHKAKALLLELHPNGLLEDSLPHPFDEFRYLGRIDEPSIYNGLVARCGAIRTFTWRWVPMYAMAQFSTQIGWHDLLAVRRGETFDPNAAPDNVHTMKSPPNLENTPDDSGLLVDRPEDPQSVRFFHEILQTCERHEVRVIAVVPPVLGGDPALLAERKRRYQELIGSQISTFQANGIYLNSFENYQDPLHLNHSGSRAFTVELARALHEEVAQHSVRN